MKALLVADNDVAIENISQVLKSAGYDTIVYKWLLKALDNIEEIAPHLIVVSTGDYPRHWKTLAQYASSGFGDYNPQVILYTDENFDKEEQKKAEILHIRGTFDSIGVDGLDTLRDILGKTDDIFSGYLTEEEQKEISVDDLVPNAQKFVEAKIKETESEPQNAETTNEISDEAKISEESDETESELNEPNADESEIREESTEMHNDDESFDSLITKFEETLEENGIEAKTAEPTLDEIEQAQLEAENDERAIEQLAEIADTEKAADRLEQLSGDEKAADKLERISGNEEILTVSDVMNDSYETENAATLPGEEELKKFLEESEYRSDEQILEDDGQNHEKDFEESENSDIIEESEEPSGENDMASEQSIDDKLAEIMNANKADAKEKAEALKLDTGTNSVSFVFTNPITLAMVSGVARNYNGLILEFTPDIPSFILNLSPGTKIGIASMKIDGKIENVFAEVMSNDAKKLALAIKK